MSGISADGTALAVLEERARRLARPLAQEANAEQVELLHFELSSRACAIETAFVHRVVRCGTLTILPAAPPYFAGAANFDGTILPVVDLAQLLDVSKFDPPVLPQALILGRDQPEFAIRVKDVHEIADVSRELLENLVASRAAGGLVRGVFPDGRLVIDGVALMDDPRLHLESPGFPMERRP